MKREGGNARDFGVKRAPFVVLLGVDVPAVLAEVSCLSNVEEEQELNTASHRAHIARYLEAGILDYLHKGDAKHEAAERTASR
jgi:N-acetylmuramoyl-L-alanine amidase